MHWPQLILQAELMKSKPQPCETKFISVSVKKRPVNRIDSTSRPLESKPQTMQGFVKFIPTCTMVQACPYYVYY